MIKFSSFTPHDKFEPKNRYEELHLAMAEYLLTKGDNFSCEIEEASVGAVRGAAMKYAQSCNYTISVHSKGNKVYIERTSANIAKPILVDLKPTPIKAELEKQLKQVAEKRKTADSDVPADNIRNVKWKGYLQQIESLPVDGFEAHFVLDEPELLRQAIANYGHRVLKDADYTFRTRIHGTSLFVRKVKH